MTKITLKRLRQLLDTCLDEGIRLAFFDPEDETQKPISEEVKEAVMMGYATALHDVREALDGNPAALEDASSPGGRLAIRGTQHPCRI